MIEKQDFEVLEQQLEQFAATRNLNSAEAKPVVDAYFQLLIDYFKQINQISAIDFESLSLYPIVPMNFYERYQYLLTRKYHFMGYRQMKTLKSELIKMAASYQTRLKFRKS
ncbi:hypothetical protein H6Y62_07105 [Staphylococcus lugdunensis]|jgi:hypothetical protein|uniref:YpoC-like domain-containing protein n=1 Tax=Staphylococcus lugdunensis TaxID=28035 RepID=A0A133Q388_STALU|nr:MULTISPECIES: hypothetical protein [Staphylococcus]ADC87545.1 Hypothetical protein in cluster with penicillin-binding protein PBP1, Staphylococcal type [Staphylococcus lugdunensis HKU09-01]AMG60683.1 hypothetical protein AL499_01640 [Staphylococcus lugdunensis]AMG63131.1 hypothetical protein AL501_02235 [Staphylococcus lugdunensis]ARB77794.1 hypothetical protein A6J61_05600 [Staphylococcus lugdunensis]ARJ09312.1 hypothetical protein B7454_07930 [Staphylococcus lugdunensis]